MCGLKSAFREACIFDVIVKQLRDGGSKGFRIARLYKNTVLIINNRLYSAHRLQRPRPADRWQKRRRRLRFELHPYMAIRPRAHR